MKMLYIFFLFYANHKQQKLKWWFSWSHWLPCALYEQAEGSEKNNAPMENGNVSVRFVFGSNGFSGDHSFHVEYIRDVKNNIMLGVAHSSVIRSFFFLVLTLEMEIMGNCLRQMCFVLLLLFFSLGRLVCCMFPVCFYISHFWN